jgi:osmoprotectant transport system permease protein
MISMMFYLPLPGRNTVVIGSKKFEEQYLLADLMQLMIEHNTDLHVQTRLNLGTTAMTHQALVRGDIDMYPEYTGTAYQLILNQRYHNNNEDLLTTLRRSYHQRFELAWLKPFLFENKQVLALTTEFANTHNLNKVSDLTRANIALSIAAPAEFLHRTDGYKALLEHYNLSFSSIRQMEPGLAYQAIKQGEVNVIMAFSTDARLLLYRLKTLKDDHKAFPHYQAAPVVREATLKAHPEIRPTIERLSTVLTANNICQLNYQVTVKHQPPKVVAYKFLKSHKLI